MNTEPGSSRKEDRLSYFLAGENLTRSINESEMQVKPELRLMYD